MWLFPPKKLFFSLFTTFFAKVQWRFFLPVLQAVTAEWKSVFCFNRLLGRLLCQKTCFYCRFVVFCRKLFVFRNFYAPLHTIFFFVVFFSNTFSAVLFLYLFMNHSLLLFFRVLQNVFACIFFLLQLCFYNCNICVTFNPFYYRKVL